MIIICKTWEDLRFLVYGSYVFLTLCQIEFFHNSDFFSSAFKHREHSLLFACCI